MRTGIRGGLIVELFGGPHEAGLEIPGLGGMAAALDGGWRRVLLVSGGEQDVFLGTADPGRRSRTRLISAG
jgi:hypothetical protein